MDQFEKMIFDELRTEADRRLFQAIRQRFIDAACWDSLYSIIICRYIAVLNFWDWEMRVPLASQSPRRLQSLAAILRRLEGALLLTPADRQNETKTNGQALSNTTF